MSEITQTASRTDAEADKDAGGGDTGQDTRRDFLNYMAIGAGIVGVGAVAWPFIDSMNPSRDVLALSTTEVDISRVGIGQSITVKWRGKPVFIRHRTKVEIEEAQQVMLSGLVDPEPDASRTELAEWIIVVGVCTHLGCVPLGNKPGEPRGEFGGWFCPCHGSHYDTSGRIRKGPAPRNLEVPHYEFLDDNTTLRIG